MARGSDAADLYERWHHQQVALVRTISASWEDSEEIVQDAWVKAVADWRKVGHLDNPAAWVTKVAVRGAISRHRRHATARRYRNLLGRPEFSDQTTDLETLDLIQRIPVGMRAPLVLHYFAGYQIAEIADQLGVREGTVKSRLARGRDALRALLDLVEEEGVRP